MRLYFNTSEILCQLQKSVTKVQAVNSSKKARPKSTNTVNFKDNCREW